MAKRPAIPFFTDQNVPDSVGRVLEEAGHKLTRLRDVMETDTADPIISVACARSGQVLVTHDNDFRQLSKRFKITQRQYHNSLHRIQLRCLEPDSANRIKESLGLIEAEWRVSKRSGKPMIIEIHGGSIRTLR